MDGKLIRNLSLATNVFLVVILSVSFMWTLKMRRKHIQARTQAKELKRVNNDYETFINSTLSANRHVGTKFPKIEMIDVKGRIISTDFEKKRGGVILLFDSNACQACLNTQLKMLREIYAQTKDPSELSVYGFTNASSSVIKRQARALGLEYSLIYDKDNMLLNTPLSKQTPIVFIVDSENTIIQCHTPVIGKPHMSALFYNEAQPHLNLSKSLFSLSGVKIVEVITNQFNSDHIKHLLF